MNFHTGQNSQDKEFSKKLSLANKFKHFPFLVKNHNSTRTKIPKTKDLPSFSTFITKVSQSNFPSLSIVTIQNFNSIFLKQKMQIQMQTCFIKKYLNFPQKDMINLRNFVPFKLNFIASNKTYTDKTKQSINKSTLNNNGKDNSKIKKVHNLRTQNLNILSFKNSII